MKKSTIETIKVALAQRPENASIAAKLAAKQALTKKECIVLIDGLADKKSANEVAALLVADVNAAAAQAAATAAHATATAALATYTAAQAAAAAAMPDDPALDAAAASALTASNAAAAAATAADAAAAAASALTHTMSKRSQKVLAIALADNVAAKDLIAGLLA